jgi:hypothetical protein
MLIVATHHSVNTGVARSAALPPANMALRSMSGVRFGERRNHPQVLDGLTALSI